MELPNREEDLQHVTEKTLASTDPLVIDHCAHTSLARCTLAISARVTPCRSAQSDLSKASCSAFICMSKRAQAMTGKWHQRSCSSTTGLDTHLSELGQERVLPNQTRHDRQRFREWHGAKLIRDTCIEWLQSPRYGSTTRNFRTGLWIHGFCSR